MLNFLFAAFQKKIATMPLYEYHCAKCGRFETLQKFSEGPLAACPTCGSSVERLISAPAFQFKGTGWYVTDYGKSGADGSASKESGSKDSKSSEAASGGSKEATTPTSADSKSSTNSPPKESAASPAPASTPAANTSQ